MKKTIYIEKRNGLFDIENIISSLGNIMNIIPNGEYIISIKKSVKQRSLDQNALMWMWFNCIEDSTGQDKHDVHDYYCKLFLRRQVTIGSKKEVVVSGTSKLSTSEFTTFLNKVQADVASELGIILPTPSDLSFQEFKNQYKNYL